ncbi:MAG: autotransporter outer membrane beta-barrel domain-containing protein, partial [Planctomycetota bacterium]|nr:autotransporter outer membrane beta-barrel domain-containing protein [Planctomycetota bacterium]
APSTGNIVNTLNRLGIRRAEHIVTGSFAGALFDFTKSGTTVDSNGSLIGDIVQDSMLILGGAGNANGAVTGLTGREGDAVARAFSGASDAMTTGVLNNTAFASQRLIRLRNANVRAAMSKVRSLASSDAHASAIMNAGCANRFWASGLGQWEDAGPRGGDLGYKIDSAGFMAGYDHVFGSVVAGGSFGYVRSDFEDKAALADDSDIDSYSLNLYATLNHSSGFFAGVMGGYMYSDFDMNRALLAAGPRDKGEYHANTWSLGTQVGYDWNPVDNLVLTPSLGLAYFHTRTGKIANTYATIDRLKEDAVQMPLDLEIRYDIPAGSAGVLSLKANAGYAYNFKNGGAEGALTYNGILNSPRVSVSGRTPGRHTLNLGAGAKVSIGRFEAALEYDYFTKKDSDAHRVMGTFGVSF